MLVDDMLACQCVHLHYVAVMECPHWSFEYHQWPNIQMALVHDTLACWYLHHEHMTAQDEYLAVMEYHMAFHRLDFWASVEDSCEFYCRTLQVMRQQERIPAEEHTLTSCKWTARALLAHSSCHSSACAQHVSHWSSCCCCNSALHSGSEKRPHSIL